MTTLFAADRAALRRTHWLESTASALAAGGVRLRVERFALTSNKLTFGAFGEAMHYLDFYPRNDAATGCIPVWGFATLSKSRCGSVDDGDRFYGYFPMADAVVLQPVGVDANGFVDGAPRRARARFRLQPVPALAHGSVLPRCRRRLDRLASPPLRHLLPDRRCPCRQSAKPWLSVVRGEGRVAAQSTYDGLRAGTVPAKEARVLAL
jgi:hypothetical protein